MSAPRLLLIDELSLGLAPAIVDRLCDALRELNRSGLTLLVVEQDVAIALDLAHHAVVMDTGRITHAGRASELAHDPAIQKAYLGTSSFDPRKDGNGEGRSVPARRLRYISAFFQYSGGRRGGSRLRDRARAPCQAGPIAEGFQMWRRT